MRRPRSSVSNGSQASGSQDGLQDGGEPAPPAPLNNYTPDSIAIAPGPLFWDIEATNDEFQGAIECHLKQGFAKRLCTECGMPFDEGKTRCFCDGCDSRSKMRGTSTNSNVNHCPRCPRYGGRRPTNRAPRAVVDAWAALGCPFQVVHTSSGYELRKLRGRHVACFAFACDSGGVIVDQYQRSNRAAASTSSVT